MMEEKQGVEVRSILVTRKPDEGVVVLNISIAIMADTELDAIGWLVSVLEDK